MSENDAYRIVIDDSGVKLQIVAALTDDCRGEFTVVRCL
jgi:hypothetical protein